MIFKWNIECSCSLLGSAVQRGSPGGALVTSVRLDGYGQSFLLQMSVSISLKPLISVITCTQILFRKWAKQNKVWGKENRQDACISVGPAGLLPSIFLIHFAGSIQSNGIYFYVKLCNMRPNRGFHDKKSDAFLSEYLTDLKLHRTK